MKIKTWDLTIIAFSLSIVGIIISAFIFGQKYHDFNVWIALLIYTIPALMLCYANGIILISIQKHTKSIYFRVGLGIVPILVLSSCLFLRKGFLNYLAIFSLIPLILTYLYWILFSSKIDIKTSV